MSNVWLTRVDGVVSEVEPGVYTNDRFVTAIRSDDTPMGKLMHSRFPSPTTIKTMNGEPSQHWIKWEDKPLDMDVVNSMMVDFEEIKPEDRLHLTRGVISSRTREVMSAADMTVTARGIRDDSMMTSPEQVLVTVVHGVYHMVEKHTLASMKNSTSVLSTSKKTRFRVTHDILTEHGNVLDVALLSSYIEPSPTLMSRAYHLGALYGMGMIHAVINNTYHRHYHAQVSSVASCWNSIR